MTVRFLGVSFTKSGHTPPIGVPEHTADIQLKPFERYREWVYLTSNYYTASDSAKLQTGEQGTFNKHSGTTEFDQYAEKRN